MKLDAFQRVEGLRSQRSDALRSSVRMSSARGEQTPCSGWNSSRALGPSRRRVPGLTPTMQGSLGGCAVMFVECMMHEWINLNSDLQTEFSTSVLLGSLSSYTKLFQP